MSMDWKFTNLLCPATGLNELVEAEKITKEIADKNRLKLMVWNNTGKVKTNKQTNNEQQMSGHILSMT